MDHKNINGKEKGGSGYILKQSSHGGGALIRKTIAKHLLLRVHDELHSPEVSKSMANALIRCINRTSEKIRRWNDYVTEIHRSIMIVHEYNVNLSKVRGKYPRSWELNQLLIRYSELEYESLYLKEKPVGKEYEKFVKNRLNTLLGLIISESLFGTDICLKDQPKKVATEIFNLLKYVNPDYRSEERIIGNMVLKLLEKMNILPLLMDLHSKKISYLSNKSDEEYAEFLNVYKSLKSTSDLGSECTSSDEEEDKDYFANLLYSKFSMGKNNAEKNDEVNTKTCSEETVLEEANEVPTEENLDDYDLQFVRVATPPDKLNKVVTFDILSDNEEEQVGYNHRVYLTKEVETSAKSLERERRRTALTHHKPFIKNEVKIELKHEEPTIVDNVELLDSDEENEQLKEIVKLPVSVKRKKRRKKKLKEACKTMQPVAEISLDSDDDITELPSKLLAAKDGDYLIWGTGNCSNQLLEKDVNATSLNELVINKNESLNLACDQTIEDVISKPSFSQKSSICDFNRSDKISSDTKVQLLLSNEASYNSSLYQLTFKDKKLYNPQSIDIEDSDTDKSVISNISALINDESEDMLSNQLETDNRKEPIFSFYKSSSDKPRSEQPCLENQDSISDMLSNITLKDTYASEEFNENHGSEDRISSDVLLAESTLSEPPVLCDLSSTSDLLRKCDTDKVADLNVIKKQVETGIKNNCVYEIEDICKSFKTAKDTFSEDTSIEATTIQSDQPGINTTETKNMNKIIGDPSNLEHNFIDHADYRIPTNTESGSLPNNKTLLLDKDILAIKSDVEEKDLSKIETSYEIKNALSENKEINLNSKIINVISDKESSFFEQLILTNKSSTSDNLSPACGDIDSITDMNIVDKQTETELQYQCHSNIEDSCKNLDTEKIGFIKEFGLEDDDSSSPESIKVEKRSLLERISVTPKALQTLKEISCNESTIILNDLCKKSENTMTENLKISAMDRPKSNFLNDTLDDKPLSERLILQNLPSKRKNRGKKISKRHHSKSEGAIHEKTDFDEQFLVSVKKDQKRIATKSHKTLRRRRSISVEYVSETIERVTKISEDPRPSSVVNKTKPSYSSTDAIVSTENVNDEKPDLKEFKHCENSENTQNVIVSQSEPKVLVLKEIVLKTTSKSANIPEKGLEGSFVEASSLQLADNQISANTVLNKEQINSEKSKLDLLPEEVELQKLLNCNVETRTETVCESVLSSSSSDKSDINLKTPLEESYTLDDNNFTHIDSVEEEEEYLSNISDGTICQDEINYHVEETKRNIPLSLDIQEIIDDWSDTEEIVLTQKLPIVSDEDSEIDFELFNKSTSMQVGKESKEHIVQEVLTEPVDSVKPSFFHEDVKTSENLGVVGTLTLNDFTNVKSNLDVLVIAAEKLEKASTSSRKSDKYLKKAEPEVSTRTTRRKTQQIRPHDFTSGSTDAPPPIKNIYQLKTLDTITTSDESNDSDGKFYIDEPEEEVVKSVYDEDTVDDQILFQNNEHELDIATRNSEESTGKLENLHVLKQDFSNTEHSPCCTEITTNQTLIHNNQYSQAVSIHDSNDATRYFVLSLPKEEIEIQTEENLTNQIQSPLNLEDTDLKVDPDFQNAGDIDQKNCVSILKNDLDDLVVIGPVSITGNQNLNLDHKPITNVESDIAEKEVIDQNNITVNEKGPLIKHKQDSKVESDAGVIHQQNSFGKLEVEVEGSNLPEPVLKTIAEEEGVTDTEQQESTLNLENSSDLNVETGSKDAEVIDQKRTGTILYDDEVKSFNETKMNSKDEFNCNDLETVVTKTMKTKADYKQYHDKFNLDLIVKLERMNFDVSDKLESANYVVLNYANKSLSHEKNTKIKCKQSDLLDFSIDTSNLTSGSAEVEVEESGFKNVRQEKTKRRFTASKLASIACTAKENAHCDVKKPISNRWERSDLESDSEFKEIKPERDLSSNKTNIRDQINFEPSSEPKFDTILGKPLKERRRRQSQFSNKTDPENKTIDRIHIGTSTEVEIEQNKCKDQIASEKSILVEMGLSGQVKERSLISSGVELNLVSNKSESRNTKSKNQSELKPSSDAGKGEPLKERRSGSRSRNSNKPDKTKNRGQIESRTSSEVELVLETDEHIKNQTVTSKKSELANNKGEDKLESELSNQMESDSEELIRKRQRSRRMSVTPGSGINININQSESESSTEVEKSERIKKRRLRSGSRMSNKSYSEKTKSRDQNESETSEVEFDLVTGEHIKNQRGMSTKSQSQNIKDKHESETCNKVESNSGELIIKRLRSRHMSVKPESDIKINKNTNKSESESSNEVEKSERVQDKKLRSRTSNKSNSEKIKRRDKMESETFNEVELDLLTDDHIKNQSEMSKKLESENIKDPLESETCNEVESDSGELLRKRLRSRRMSVKPESDIEINKNTNKSESESSTEAEKSERVKERGLRSRSRTSNKSDSEKNKRRDKIKSETSSEVQFDLVTGEHIKNQSEMSEKSESENVEDKLESEACNEVKSDSWELKRKRLRSRRMSVKPESSFEIDTNSIHSESESSGEVEKGNRIKERRSRSRMSDKSDSEKSKRRDQIISETSSEVELDLVPAEHIKNRSGMSKKSGSERVSEPCKEVESDTSEIIKKRLKSRRMSVKSELLNTCINQSDSYKDFDSKEETSHCGISNESKAYVNISFEKTANLDKIIPKEFKLKNKYLNRNQSESEPPRELELNLIRDEERRSRSPCMTFKSDFGLSSECENKPNVPHYSGMEFKHLKEKLKTDFDIPADSKKISNKDDNESEPIEVNLDPLPGESTKKRKLRSKPSISNESVCSTLTTKHLGTSEVSTEISQKHASSLECKLSSSSGISGLAKERRSRSKSRKARLGSKCVLTVNEEVGTLELLHGKNSDELNKVSAKISKGLQKSLASEWSCKSDSSSNQIGLSEGAKKPSSRSKSRKLKSEARCILSDSNKADISEDKLQERVTERLNWIPSNTETANIAISKVNNLETNLKSYTESDKVKPKKMDKNDIKKLKYKICKKNKYLSNSNLSCKSDSSKELSNLILKSKRAKDECSRSSPSRNLKSASYLISIADKNISSHKTQEVVTSEQGINKCVVFDMENNPVVTELKESSELVCQVLKCNVSSAILDSHHKKPSIIMETADCVVKNSKSENIQNRSFDVEEQRDTSVCSIKQVCLTSVNKSIDYSEPNLELEVSSETSNTNVTKEVNLEAGKKKSESVESQPKLTTSLTKCKAKSLMIESKDIVNENWGTSSAEVKSVTENPPLLANNEAILECKTIGLENVETCLTENRPSSSTVFEEMSQSCNLESTKTESDLITDFASPKICKNMSIIESQNKLCSDTVDNMNVIKDKEGSKIDAVKCEVISASWENSLKSTIGTDNLYSKNIKNNKVIKPKRRSKRSQTVLEINDSQDINVIPKICEEPSSSNCIELTSIKAKPVIEATTFHLLQIKESTNDETEFLISSHESVSNQLITKCVNPEICEQVLKNKEHTEVQEKNDNTYKTLESEEDVNRPQVSPINLKSTINKLKQILESDGVVIDPKENDDIENTEHADEPNLNEPESKFETSSDISLDDIPLTHRLIDDKSKTFNKQNEIILGVELNKLKESVCLDNISLTNKQSESQTKEISAQKNDVGKDPIFKSSLDSVELDEMLLSEKIKINSKHLKCEDVKRVSFKYMDTTSAKHSILPKVITKETLEEGEIEEGDLEEGEIKEDPIIVGKILKPASLDYQEVQKKGGVDLLKSPKSSYHKKNKVQKGSVPKFEKNSKINSDVIRMPNKVDAFSLNSTKIQKINVSFDYEELKKKVPDNIIPASKEEESKTMKANVIKLTEIDFLNLKEKTQEILTKVKNPVKTLEKSKYEYNPIKVSKETKETLKKNPLVMVKPKVNTKVEYSKTKKRSYDNDLKERDVKRHKSSKSSHKEYPTSLGNTKDDKARKSKLTDKSVDKLKVSNKPKHDARSKDHSSSNRKNFSSSKCLDDLNKSKLKHFSTKHKDKIQHKNVQKSNKESSKHQNTKVNEKIIGEDIDNKPLSTLKLKSTINKVVTFKDKLDVISTDKPNAENIKIKCSNNTAIVPVYMSIKHKIMKDYQREIEKEEKQQFEVLNKFPENLLIGKNMNAIASDTCQIQLNLKQNKVVEKLTNIDDKPAHSECNKVEHCYNEILTTSSVCKDVEPYFDPVIEESVIMDCDSVIEETVLEETVLEETVLEETVLEEAVLEETSLDQTALDQTLIVDGIQEIPEVKEICIKVTQNCLTTMVKTPEIEHTEEVQLTEDSNHVETHVEYGIVETSIVDGPIECISQIQNNKQDARQEQMDVDEKTDFQDVNAITQVIPKVRRKSTTNQGPKLNKVIDITTKIYPKYRRRTSIYESEHRNDNQNVMSPLKKSTHLITDITESKIEKNYSQDTHSISSVEKISVIPVSKHARTNNLEDSEMNIEPSICKITIETDHITEIKDDTFLKSEILKHNDAEKQEDVSVKEHINDATFKENKSSKSKRFDINDVDNLIEKHDSSEFNNINVCNLKKVLQCKMKPKIQKLGEQSCSTSILIHPELSNKTKNEKPLNLSDLIDASSVDTRTVIMGLFSFVILNVFSILAKLVGNDLNSEISENLTDYANVETHQVFTVNTKEQIQDTTINTKKKMIEYEDVKQDDLMDQTVAEECIVQEDIEDYCIPDKNIRAMEHENDETYATHDGILYLENDIAEKAIKDIAEDRSNVSKKYEAIQKNITDPLVEERNEIIPTSAVDEIATSFHETILLENLDVEASVEKMVCRSTPRNDIDQEQDAPSIESENLPTAIMEHELTEVQDKRFENQLMIRFPEEDDTFLNEEIVGNFMLEDELISEEVIEKIVTDDIIQKVEILEKQHIFEQKNNAQKSLIVTEEVKINEKGKSIDRSMKKQKYVTNNATKMERNKFSALNESNSLISSSDAAEEKVRAIEESLKSCDYTVVQARTSTPLEEVDETVEDSSFDLSDSLMTIRNDLVPEKQVPVQLLESEPSFKFEKDTTESLPESRYAVIDYDSFTELYSEKNNIEVPIDDIPSIFPITHMEDLPIGEIKTNAISPVPVNRDAEADGHDHTYVGGVFMGFNDVLDIVQANKYAVNELVTLCGESPDENIPNIGMLEKKDTTTALIENPNDTSNSMDSGLSINPGLEIKPNLDVWTNVTNNENKVLVVPVEEMSATVHMSQSDLIRAYQEMSQSNLVLETSTLNSSLSSDQSLFSTSDQTIISKKDNEDSNEDFVSRTEASTSSKKDYLCHKEGQQKPAYASLATKTGEIQPEQVQFPKRKYGFTPVPTPKKKCKPSRPVKAPLNSQSMTEVIKGRDNDLEDIIPLQKKSEIFTESKNKSLPTLTNKDYGDKIPNLKEQSKVHVRDTSFLFSSDESKNKVKDKTCEKNEYTINYIINQSPTHKEESKPPTTDSFPDITNNYKRGLDIVAPKNISVKRCSSELDCMPMIQKKSKLISDANKEEKLPLTESLDDIFDRLKLDKNQFNPNPPYNKTEINSAEELKDFSLSHPIKEHPTMQSDQNTRSTPKVNTLKNISKTQQALPQTLQVKNEHSAINVDPNMQNRNTKQPCPRKTTHHTRKSRQTEEEVQKIPDYSDGNSSNSSKNVTNSKQEQSKEYAYSQTSRTSRTRSSIQNSVPKKHESESTRRQSQTRQANIGSSSSVSSAENITFNNSSSQVDPVCESSSRFSSNILNKTSSKPSGTSSHKTRSKTEDSSSSSTISQKNSTCKPSTAVTPEDIVQGQNKPVTFYSYSPTPNQDLSWMDRVQGIIKEDNPVGAQFPPLVKVYQPVLYPGKFAQCKDCGCLSKDFNKCMNCSQKISKEAKVFIIENGKYISYKGPLEEIPGYCKKEHIKIKCKTVRIGSFRAIPIENVLLASTGFTLKIPHTKHKGTCTLHIKLANIMQITANFDYSLPAVFYHLSPTLGDNISQLLGVEKSEISINESHICLTLLFEKFTDIEKHMIKRIYHSKVRELSCKEANSIFMESCLGTKADLPPRNYDSNDVLLRYPPEGAGSLDIKINDYRCLETYKYINDKIVEFYLTYLVNNLKQERKKNVHVFSPFFFKSLSLTNDRYARAKSWTKKVNIFKKDFLIIPVNEDLHWFLVIVCFPGMKGCETFDGIPCCPEGKPILSEKRTAEMQLDTLETTEDVIRPPIKQACILRFDSLNRSSDHIYAKVREFLRCEYQAKENKNIPYNPDKIKGFNVKVPTQKNLTDCGLYLLQYVEEFLKNPINDFHFPIMDLSNWFEDSAATKKREDLSILIKSLMLKYDYNIDLIPKINH